MIDHTWVARVHAAARVGSRRARLADGPRLLLAAIIATAVDDLLEDGPVAADAAAYFAGPLYRHHITLLGLPPDSLPAGVDEAVLHELLAAAPPRSMSAAEHEAGVDVITMEHT